MNFKRLTFVPKYKYSKEINKTKSSKNMKTFCDNFHNIFLKRNGFAVSQIILHPFIVNKIELYTFTKITIVLFDEAMVCNDYQEGTTNM